MSNHKVIIVGAGLAGLSCALSLEKFGIDCVLLEASDAVGGRIRTDSVDGFLLDRGFQVMLTSYPETRRLLNYDLLNLKSFKSGALVRHQGRFHRICDPWRDPLQALSTLCTPVGNLNDKLQIAKMRMALCGESIEKLLTRTEMPTIESLRKQGFSDSIINTFFRPFFGGVFLEKDLSTSSRMFDFLFTMFSTGEASIPERGMQDIPEQLANRIGANKIRLKQKVVAISDNTVLLSSGEQLKADNIVVAIEGSAVAELLYDMPSGHKSKAVTCLYFSADLPPLEEPILVLNGDGTGPVNNLCVPSSVSSAYAPEGKSLVSVTVLGNPEIADDFLEDSVRAQLFDWFGLKVNDWKHLRTYRIKYALPAQAPPTRLVGIKSYRLKDGLYVCGDHMSTASINGALESGRHVAELIADKTPLASAC